MLLDELRIMARHKKEEAYNDPNTKQTRKEYVDVVEQLLSNEDYIKAAPKSTMKQLLYFLGYEFKQLDEIYDQLMAEVNKTYDVISPEQLAEDMGIREK